VASGVEPLWKAVNDVNLPLHFQRSRRSRPASSTSRRGSRGARRSSRWSPVPDEPRQHLGGGDLPRCSSAIRTSGSRSARAGSVIPYALDRMDFEWEPLPRPRLTMSRATTGAASARARSSSTAIGTKLIEDMGVETLMWGSTIRTVTAYGPSRRNHRGAVRPPPGRRHAQRSPARTRASSTG